MTTLFLAALSFAALHLLVSGTRLRTTLVARLGERPYRGLFSLASAGLLAWLIGAYVSARQPAVTPLYEYRWIAAILMFVALTFIVLGLLTPGPTIVGGEKRLEREEAARGVHRITRHPFLWGVALWAVTHIVFNLTLPHGLFFGTFLLVALVGTASIDAKRARQYGEPWQRYARQTSNVPFAAIAGGRNRLAWSEFGVLKLLVALAAYGLFAVLHQRFFGVAPF